jgi:hypothetical protein
MYFNGAARAVETPAPVVEAAKHDGYWPETQPGDEWRWHPDYVDRYMVSKRGGVRSHLNGRVTILSSYPMRSLDREYYYITLVRADGVRVTRRLHLLVLETFVGRRPDGHHGAHLDDDPSNNALDNLAWVTALANQKMRKRCGRRPGSRNMSPDVVRSIRQRHAAGGESYRMLSKSTGLSQKTIYDVVTRKTYRGVE